MAVNFDLVARPYRWLEYLTFGPLLQRCRTTHLAHLAGAGRALVLGDGDGRFLARLLAINPMLTADVVDSSRLMLRILESRIGPARQQIHFHHADALVWEPTGSYDLIVTHFFLDCFFPQQLDHLLDRILPHAEPGAQWVISEFATPGKLTAGVVGLLYRAFGMLTGLKVRALPDYSSTLRKRGLILREERRYLRGLLCSQIWSLPSDLRA